MTAFSLLVAEMQWKKGAPEIRRITPDWTAVRGLRKPPGVVVRIFPSMAGTHWNSRAVDALAGLLDELAVECTTNGAAGGDVQLDYDCPESKLGEYGRLIVELKRRQPGRLLTITALPSWLRHAEFALIAREVPGYVLQVHSLHLPQSRSGLATLCDASEARAAVRGAAELRVPFRVALPTYSCVVQFDAAGKVSEVFAEDLPSGFPQTDTPYIVLDSDAFECQELLAEWKEGPDQLKAVIWYRLPVKSDRLNWDWSTLQKLCRREPLRRGWVAEAMLTPELHHEIVLRNTGDAPDDLPPLVSLHAKEGRIAASDGLRGYSAEGLPDGSLRLRLAQPVAHARAPAGTQLRIGWCRTATERTPVAAEVILR
jgi:hypothetical protein